MPKKTVQHDDEELWERWLGPATEALGQDRQAVPVKDLLRLTAVIAHGVDRPMAPVSAYLAGLAVGGGADVEEVLKRLTGLAQDFSS